MLKLITWPFELMGWILETVFSIVGGLLGFFIGLGLCAAGVALCHTIIGAVLGIPMLLIGGSLMVHSIF